MNLHTSAGVAVAPLMIGSALPSNERRAAADRRCRLWWSLYYGNVKPRRRLPSRRRTETRYHLLDWHAAHLLAAALGILLLSAGDAFMTLTLLAGGAIEVNPVMAAVVGQSAGLFAAVKMALTGSGVITMVVLSRYRFLRVLRVDVVIYCLLAGYVALLAHELSMLSKLAFFAGP